MIGRRHFDCLVALIVFRVGQDGGNPEEKEREAGEERVESGIPKVAGTRRK